MVVTDRNSQGSHPEKVKTKSLLSRELESPRISGELIEISTLERPGFEGEVHVGVQVTALLCESSEPHYFAHQMSGKGTSNHHRVSGSQDRYF